MTGPDRRSVKRLAIGGLVHETVTFLPQETELAAFEHRAVRGDEIAQAFAGSNTVYGEIGRASCRERV